MIKLPKSWKHWCRLANLRPYNSRRTDDWAYVKGRGHHWRVNVHGEFQMGDPYARFDRWALSEIVAAPLPTTEQMFLTTVDSLTDEMNKRCP